MTGSENKCRQCGIELRSAADGGYCPQCALEQAFGAATDEISPTMVDEPPVSEQTGDRIGHYKLLQKIGEGGFGVVYMAEQKEPVKRRVALKVIKLGMDTRQVVARFEAERQALAMMDHPNIAKVFDAGTTNSGRPYFVMELVRGISITQFCDEKNLGTGERLELFIDVCNAIQHAHQKGVVHRDLKPSNVMVTLHDDKAVPKVIDFGVAKATQSDLTDMTLFTQYGQFIGTPAYMSPEQAQMSGLDIDTRSDIYSLGVLLYELLTGRTPFDPEEFVKGGYDEIRRKIREDEPPRPSTRLSLLGEMERTDLAKHRGSAPDKLRTALRGDLDWIIMKALEKDRTRRYDSANGMAADIRRHLNDEPVSAVAPSAVYQLRKYARRHRAAFGMAATITVMLLVATAVSLWFAVDAWHANNGLEKEIDRAEDGEKLAREFAAAAGQANDELNKAYTNLEKEKARAEDGERDAKDQKAKADKALLVSRDEQGKGWLGKANLLLEHKQHLGAKLMAASAVGFEGYGRGSQNRGFKDLYLDLLKPDSPERKEVANLIRYQPDFPLIWVSPMLPYPSADPTAIAYNRDGSRLATSIPYGTISIWDTSTGERIGEPLEADGRDPVTGIAFSPDGKTLASSRSRGSVQIWDVSSRDLRQADSGQGSVNTISFSADGERLATAGGDGTIRVWDGLTLEPALTLRVGNEPVRAARFSPVDRDRLASTGDSGTVVVWDVASRKRQDVPDVHTSIVRDVRFSLDGRFLASAGEDGKAIIRSLDASTASVILVLKGGSDSGMTSVDFSPIDRNNGRQVVTGGTDGSVRVWDLMNGGLIHRFVGHRGKVVHVGWNPDGTTIASRGVDDTLRIWDTQTRAELTQHAGHSLAITRIDISPDGRLVATASVDRTIRLWDVSTGREKRVLGHEDQGGVWDVAFSSDSEWLASGDEKGNVCLWNIESGRHLMLGATQVPVKAVAFSSDGRSIATAGIDAAVTLWSIPDLATAGIDAAETLLKSREDKPTRLIGHDDFVYSLSFDPNGRFLASGGLDETVRLWDLTATDPAEVGEPLDHSAMVRGVAFSPDGTLLATVDEDATVHLWDVATGLPLGSFQSHNALVRALTFSPDGTTLATASEDATVRVWDVHSHDLITELVGHKGAVADIVFSPDGATLFSAGDDKTIRLWEIEGGHSVLGRTMDGLNAVSFHPDGEILAAAGDEGTVWVWEKSTGRERAALTGNPGAVNALKFAPNGATLASSREDGVIDLWDVKSQVKIAVLKGHTHPLSALVFNPDSSMLASGGIDCFLRVWDLARGDLAFEPVPIRERISGLAFSPDGSTLAVAASYSRVIHLYKLTDDKAELIGFVPPGVHNRNSRITCVAFSLDGKILAIGARNRELALWNLESREKIASLYHGGELSDILFTGDDKFVISAGRRGVIHVWDTEAVLAQSNLSNPPLLRTPLLTLDRNATPVRDLSIDRAGGFLASASADGIVRLWDLKRFDRDLSVYAGYMDKFEFDEDRNLVWSMQSYVRSNMLKQPQFPLAPVASGTHVDLLHSRRARSVEDRNLFWRLFRARNWDGAAVLLARYPAGQWVEERLALARGLTRDATALASRGRSNVALHRLSTAETLSPEDPEIYRAKAMVLSESDSVGSAIAEIDRGLAIVGTGNAASLGLELDRYQFHATRGDMELARRNLDQVAARTNNVARLLQPYVDAYVSATLPEFENAGTPAAADGLLMAAVLEVFRRALISDRMKASEIRSLQALTKLAMESGRPEQLIIGKDAEWRYLDDGVEAAPEWIEQGFDSGKWSIGRGPFGFSEPDQRTTLNRNEDGTSLVKPSFITYYFRHSFNLPEPPDRKLLMTRVLMDDGIVVYLNGVEIARNNMAEGTVSGQTFAFRAIHSQGEEAPVHFEINPLRVRLGENILAVELHQANQESTTLKLSFELIATDLTDETYLSEFVTREELAAAIDRAAEFLPPTVASDWIPRMRFAFAGSRDDATLHLQEAEADLTHWRVRRRIQILMRNTAAAVEAIDRELALQPDLNDDERNRLTAIKASLSNGRAIDRWTLFR